MTKRENGKIEYVPEPFQKMVCHNSRLQPYINAFHLQGSNIDQKKMGDIFGVVQILDHSENSAYIPNLLAQVIKKEFFLSTKRDFEASFEAALHKANLALTDLAQHEIIEWIGNLNAVIGAVQNERFNFTQAGGGKILLLREKKLTEISKGLDSGEGIGHPIKTFSNISSGKLELGDKLVFATDSAFEALRMDEIKRHAETFNSEEFDNIVCSTLDLEGENSALLLVNVKEKSLQEESSASKKELPDPEKTNFFGSQKKEAPQKNDEKKDVALKKKSSQKPADKAEEATEQTDRQLKEEKTELEQKEPLTKAQALAAAEEKIRLSSSGRQEKKVPKNEVAHQEKKEEPSSEYYNAGTPVSPFEKEPELFLKEEELRQENDEEAGSKNDSLYPFLEAAARFAGKGKQVLQKTFSFGGGALAGIKNKFIPLGRQKEEALNQRKQEKAELDNNFKKNTAVPTRKRLPASSLMKKNIRYLKIFTLETGGVLKNFFISIRQKIQQFDVSNINFKFLNKANFKKIPGAVLEKAKNFNLKNVDGDGVKLLALTGVVMAIVATLFLGIKLIRPVFEDDLSGKQIIGTSPSLIEDAVLEKEAPVSELRSVANLQEKTISLTSLNNELFAVTAKKSFLKINSRESSMESIELPDYINEIKSITAMPPLQLVFLITADNVFSYSPVTKRFYNNQIELPDGLDIKSSDVYLTYIYLLDRNSGQIYQYPRATGGFGEKNDWLEASADFSEANNIAINGSIYVTYQNGTIEEYFRGEKQADFQLDQTEPAIYPHKIRASTESETLFVLDSQNKRIAEISRSGEIVKQYQDEAFLGAQNFWVDFGEKIIYIISSKNELFRFNYN